MSEPRWLDDREAHVWQAHLAMHRELAAELERQLVRESGLSGAEYTILVPLSEAPDGVLRARELGAAAGWDRSRLSHQVTRMEKRGLVAREPCVEDGRGSMIRLTDEGRAAIEAAAPGHVAAVRRHFFDPLTAEEVELLGTLLDRILATLPADQDPSLVSRS
jgi:DNA-binding MarR family transcriptional regulator